MLKKRIIACLDIKDGRTVKGINFVDITDVGDPVDHARHYAEQGIDELVFLDITASIEKRKILIELVKHIAQAIDIPFTVGGGIQTLDDAKILIQSGADKVSLNSAAVKRPQLITEIAEAFGRQCVVLAIDSKDISGEDKVFIHGGRTETHLNTIQWASEGVSLGAGEILLTSMDKDGTKTGFDIRLLKEVCSAVQVPVIASGGAGTPSHFKQVFEETKSSAALAASLFHYRQVSVPDLKEYLNNNKISVRCQ